MKRLACLAIAFALAAPASAQPGPARDEGPAVTREADGSFTIHRAIEADGPATAAHGLVELDGPGRPARTRPETKRRDRERADEALRRAYEEAVDWARQAGPNGP